jgi:glycosyltransferase involved in cell wall biosynthesis
VITLSPSVSAHLAGYALASRGVPWIADFDASAFAASSTAQRLILSADALTCGDAQTRRLAFDHGGASAALVAADCASAIDRQVEALLAWRRPGSGMRILMIGPVNSPHMEHLARALQTRGHRVRAGGAVWQDGLAPSILPDAGIPVSKMMRPQPLWMRRLLRRSRPDLVHANWLPFAALATLAGARPLVAMAWGSDVYLAGRLERGLNRLAARRADLCLCDSAALRQSVIELGAAADHVKLINWGVDLQTFRPAASTEEKSALKASLGLRDDPVVISPRGFKDLYNPGVVIDAFARVLTQLPDAQLVLKHNGDQTPDLGRLSGSGQIHVVGSVPYEQMAQYLKAADVCLSIPDTDSSPRSVWEAMACGCACVLSDLPWVGELIEADRHALVVPVDPDAVGAATSRLLTDSMLWRSVTDEALKLVHEQRDADREMGRLEQLYARLAQAADRGGPDRGGPDRGAPAATASSSTAASSAVSSRRE